MGLLRIQWHPTSKILRSFGFFAFVFFGLGGNWIAGRSTLLGMTLAPSVSNGIGLLLGIIAAGSLILGIAYPRGLRPLFLALSVITAPIGLLVSTVMLTAFWVLLITPLGLLRRLLGWDPMERKWKSDGSYWAARKEGRGSASYFNPY
jgi:hypothetical protein